MVLFPACFDSKVIQGYLLQLLQPGSQACRPLVPSAVGSPLSLRQHEIFARETVHRVREFLVESHGLLAFGSPYLLCPQSESLGHFCAVATEQRPSWRIHRGQVSNANGNNFEVNLPIV